MIEFNTTSAQDGFSSFSTFQLVSETAATLDDEGDYSSVTNYGGGTTIYDSGQGYTTNVEGEATHSGGEFADNSSYLAGTTTASANLTHTESGATNNSDDGVSSSFTTASGETFTTASLALLTTSRITDTWTYTTSSTLASLESYFTSSEFYYTVRRATNSTSPESTTTASSIGTTTSVTSVTLTGTQFNTTASAGTATSTALFPATSTKTFSYDGAGLSSITLSAPVMIGTIESTFPLQITTLSEGLYPASLGTDWPWSCLVTAGADIAIIGDTASIAAAFTQQTFWPPLTPSAVEYTPTSFAGTDTTVSYSNSPSTTQFTINALILATPSSSMSTITTGALVYPRQTTTTSIGNFTTSSSHISGGFFGVSGTGLVTTTALTVLGVSSTSETTVLYSVGLDSSTLILTTTTLGPYSYTVNTVGNGYVNSALTSGSSEDDAGNSYSFGGTTNAGVGAATLVNAAPGLECVNVSTNSSDPFISVFDDNFIFQQVPKKGAFQTPDSFATGDPVGSNLNFTMPGGYPSLYYPFTSLARENVIVPPLLETTASYFTTESTTSTSTITNTNTADPASTTSTTTLVPADVTSWKFSYLSYDLFYTWIASTTTSNSATSWTINRQQTGSGMFELMDDPDSANTYWQSKAPMSIFGGYSPVSINTELGRQDSGGVALYTYSGSISSSGVNTIGEFTTSGSGVPVSIISNLYAFSITPGGAPFWDFSR